MQKLLTIEDITQLLGIGRNTAYQLIRKIKHIKIGRRILVDETNLMKFIEQNSDFKQTKNKP